MTADDELLEIQVELLRRQTVDLMTTLLQSTPAGRRLLAIMELDAIEREVARRTV